ncbi:MAG: hypothetical protein ACOYJB_07290 [Christensenellaceae bacterium]|jgi:ABC-2 type transport system permease protein
MNNQLWLLLKVKLKGGKPKRPAPQRTLANSKLGGGVKAQAAQASPQPRRQGGIVVTMGISAVVITGIAFGFCYALGMVLAATNALHVLPALLMAAASIMCLVTTVYKTNGILFGFSDYDLLMSLPIKNSTIIVSRMLMLYTMNILYTLFFVVPSLVVYGMFAPITPLFVLFSIVLVALIPLIPIVLATIIGCLIALAASRFKRKTGASMVFTIAALIIWMLFAFNMDAIVSNLAVFGEQIISMVNKVYPLAALYTNALTQGDVLSFLAFVLISIAIFGAFVWVVGKNFKRINTAITTDRTTSDYKMGSLKQSPPQKALFTKEWKRFTGSSTYMMNTGVGVILLLLFSVVLLVFGGEVLQQFIGMPVSVMGVGAPFISAFCIVMCCTTAASVSIEGKQLWITKSLPVSTKDILKAKLRVNLQLLLPAVLISSTLLAVALKMPPLDTLMLYVLPLAYAFYTALFGLFLNLRYPKFDWDSEIRIIKQGTPIMVVILVGMAISLGPMVLTFFAGKVVSYVMAAVLIVISILLYRSIATKGVKTFDSFSA